MKSSPPSITSIKLIAPKLTSKLLGPVGSIVGTGVPVLVGEFGDVGVSVGVDDGGVVGVAVADGTGVLVGVDDGGVVGVAVADGTGVLVGVDDATTVGVLVGVFVGDGAAQAATAGYEAVLASLPD